MLDIGDGIPAVVDLAREKLSLGMFSAICFGLTGGLFLWWMLF